jgi:hypothetical protein
MPHSRQDDFLSRSITAEFVGNDHPELTSGSAQQLAKEPLCRKPVPLRLHQNIDHRALLIRRTPETVLYIVDL